jgi:putative transcriptional regulator
MLRFKFKALLAEKEFSEDRQITMQEVSQQTGVNRMTLSKLSNHKGHNTSSDVINKLCNYFGCKIEDLIEHIPD